MVEHIASSQKKEYSMPMDNVKVISLGGSIVAPSSPDTLFLSNLKKLISSYLDEDKNRKLIFVVGGGGPARLYQSAAKELLPTIKSDSLDWIGIMATRLNAQFVKEIFYPYCIEPVVTDPSAPFTFNGQLLLAAGWKPGFSTDADAVFLAKKCNATTIINLSNISKIYSDDPKKNPNAVPIDHLTWEQYKNMIGQEWVPGKNSPFDPVATKEASAAHLTVITASGKDLENISNILYGKEFIGSTIS